MGETPDESIPESMYDTRAEEMFCVCADSNGLALQLVDGTDENVYWLYPGVTGWAQERIRGWVEGLLEGHDYAIEALPEGPVEVEIYE